MSARSCPALGRRTTVIAYTMFFRGFVLTGPWSARRLPRPVCSLVEDDPSDNAPSPLLVRLRDASDAARPKLVPYAPSFDGDRRRPGRGEQRRQRRWCHQRDPVRSHEHVALFESCPDEGRPGPQTQEPKAHEMAPSEDRHDSTAWSGQMRDQRILGRPVGTAWRRHVDRSAGHLDHGRHEHCEEEVKEHHGPRKPTRSRSCSVHGGGADVEQPHRRRRLRRGALGSRL